MRWNGNIYGPNNNIYQLKNGKGFIKEFDYGGNLIFEGEYLNGKRNGKGKEYKIFGPLEFEGEYLNGAKNGKGKKYYYNGILYFEGEYLNDKKNGKGKEYHIDDGKLIFDGEYLYNEKRKGKLYIDGQLEFEGEYLYDKKYDGKGYGKNGNIIYELSNGNGQVNEYYKYGNYYKLELEFIGEYKNGIKMEKEKDIIIMVI